MACSCDHEERVLNSDEWRVEAAAVIYDVQDHVQEIAISDELGCGDQHIYLNLTTREMEKYCVELTAQGFRIVGRDYNKTDMQNGPYYETPYSLLNSISPLYREAFGNSLASKLLELHHQRLNDRRPSQTE